MVCFLEKFPLMGLHDLLNQEGDIKSLEAYLRECFLILFQCLLFVPFFFPLIYFFLSFVVCAEPMMPLFGAERRKYLVDMKAKKTDERYSASDPASVLQRKVNRKDVDAGAGGSAMDVDNANAVGHDALVEQEDSPKPKNMNTGKGGESRHFLRVRDLTRALAG
jgi:hypothetical protein